MVKIDLAKVMGTTKDEQSLSLLLGIWQSCNTRPSRRTLWVFAALAVVLQGLLVFKWYFYDQDAIIIPSYDIDETVGLVTAVSHDMSHSPCSCETLC